MSTFAKQPNMLYAQRIASLDYSDCNTTATLAGNRQFIQHLPHMTELANTIEAPMQLLGLSRNEATERARELLSMLSLADKCNHLARALTTRPKMMSFDEVTSRSIASYAAKSTIRRCKSLRIRWFCCA